MADRWVVIIHAEDGRHVKVCKSKEHALEQFESQIGSDMMASNKEALLENLDTKGFKVVDFYGRVVIIGLAAYSRCVICGKTGLVGKIFKLGKTYEVCDPCADGFECGRWTVESDKNGNPRIKRHKLEWR